MMFDMNLQYNNSGFCRSATNFKLTVISKGQGEKHSDLIEKITEIETKIKFVL